MSFLSQIFSGGTTNGTGTTVPTNPNIINPYQNADQLNQATAGVNQQLMNQQGLQNQLGAQNGLGNQSSVYNQQQGLANALMAQSQGAGPNPAQAQLAQNTGANVSNQAALMAGQRGASANPALIAREAAQQGAATQQNAVGQAATLQAQQQLAAQQQLQQQQQNLAGLATQQAGQQIQGQNTLTGQNLNQQQAIMGSLSQQNATQAGITNTQQAGQNALNEGNQKEANTILNSIPQAAGSALSLLAGGGEVKNPKLGAVGSDHRFPEHAMLPPHLKSIATLYHGDSYKTHSYQEQTKMAYGGETSVGEKLKQGGGVPGKAKVKGDSLKNDTVAAKLSPGEVVLPRSVMQSDDPASAAAQFVEGIQKKKGADTGKHQAEFKDALKRAIAGRKKK